MLDIRAGDIWFTVAESADGYASVLIRAQHIDTADPMFYAGLEEARRVAAVLEMIIDLNTKIAVYNDHPGGRDAFVELLRDDPQRLFRVAADLDRIMYQDDFRPTDNIFWLAPKVQELVSLTQRITKQRKAQPGYVYVLQSETGHYKIGRARDPISRQKTFGVKLPFRVNYEIVIEADNYVELERDLHDRFAYCRLDGEWFNLTEGDIADLRREFKDVSEQFNNE